MINQQSPLCTIKLRRGRNPVVGALLLACEHRHRSFLFYP
jgi:hypothetical protein